ncbi:uncharacterized protein [Mycetomoellerius zeteki]|uniref:uncharacterized protein n=1 Tax=Mycetomoellerius zeteki TaxID=64791 RepID=UPI00084E66E7|nr:PREDICTED: uncharacterized protein LOC108730340 [Trachymyrmex zeteki]
MPNVVELLDKIRKVLRFLVECLSSWIAMGRRDDPVMVKRLITMAVTGVEKKDANKALVYVKGHEKREWLVNILNSGDLTVETLDADYEDIDSLHNLDVTNTMRCGKHVKNCALQNVFKIYNWWSQRQKDLYQV